MSAKLSATNRATVAGLGAAVHRNATFSRAGVLERLFTFAFKGLVYPQIWEDPVVDMEALAIRPDDHIVAIASGGCNVMSYLTANPARITAVDLNGAHIALNRLKLRAARDLPDYEAFHRFFARADLRRKCRGLRSLDQAQSRPDLARLLGGPHDVRTAARRAFRAQFLSLWAAWIFHRRRAFAGARARQGSARNAAGGFARRAARPVRQRARAAVRNALGPLARPATRDALWPRHSAGAISCARRRRGGRDDRGFAGSAAPARLRLRFFLQLLRKAGVRTRLRRGRGRGDAALSRKGGLRRRSRARGPR